MLIAVDHIGVFCLHLFKEGAKNRGVFLKITIDQKTKFAFGMIQARHQSLVVTEVAREFNDANPVVVARQRARDFQRIVRRTVINHDDFIIVCDASRGFRRASAKLLNE